MEFHALQFVLFPSCQSVVTMNTNILSLLEGCPGEVLVGPKMNNLIIKRAGVLWPLVNVCPGFGQDRAIFRWEGVWPGPRFVLYHLGHCCRWGERNSLLLSFSWGEGVPPVKKRWQGKLSGICLLPWAFCVNSSLSYTFCY